MVGHRITFAFLVGCLATPVAAADRAASFGVSVRVVAPLRVRTSAAPAATAAAPGGAGWSTSAPATLVTMSASGGAAIPTVLPDGAPTAIVER